MLEKKTIKANLENKKFIFSEIGLIIALSITLFAFEWKSYDKIELDLGGQLVVAIDEDIMINTQQVEPPPPPPPQQQTTVLNIVEDNVDVENDLEIDAEADQDTKIDEYIPIDDDETNVEELEIFTVVEEAPSFPGGDESRIKYLQNNIKYPEMARESGIQGTVYVTFVVEIHGTVTKVT